MLFERIRRTQKPVFIFLAITFALGFAFLGVGSGGGGINPFDFLGGGSSGSPSISDLAAKVAKNQSDAESWLKLAQAYQTANQPDQAIAAYQRYIALRPNDALEMTSLAGLLEQRGDQLNTIGRAYATRAQDAQGQTGALATGRLKLAPGLTQKVADTLAAPLQQRAQELSSQAQGEFTQAISLRKRLLKLDPTNSTNAFFLGTDGLNARDYPTALSAFQRYLKLVPNAANKAQVKDAIKQLELITSAAGGSG